MNLLNLYASASFNSTRSLLASLSAWKSGCSLLLYRLRIYFSLYTTLNFCHVFYSSGFVVVVVSQCKKNRIYARIYGRTISTRQSENIVCRASKCSMLPCFCNQIRQVKFNLFIERVEKNFLPQQSVVQAYIVRTLVRGEANIMLYIY